VPKAVLLCSILSPVLMSEIKFEPFLHRPDRTASWRSSVRPVIKAEQNFCLWAKAREFQRRGSMSHGTGENSVACSWGYRRWQNSHTQPGRVAASQVTGEMSQGPLSWRDWLQARSLYQVEKFESILEGRRKRRQHLKRYPEECVHNFGEWRGLGSPLCHSDPGKWD
jgi:hypothetical protein